MHGRGRFINLDQANYHLTVYVPHLMNIAIVRMLSISVKRINIHSFFLSFFRNKIPLETLTLHYFMVPVVGGGEGEEGVNSFRSLSKSFRWLIFTVPPNSKFQLI